MTKLNQIYRCSVCGNVAEILHSGVGALVCCNQPMELQQENSKDASGEKHLPVIKETDKGIIVSVGSVAHPMEKEHFIEWIEVLFDGKSDRKFLNPGDEPSAEFAVKPKEFTARAYCNIHGLWKK